MGSFTLLWGSGPKKTPLSTEKGQQERNKVPVTAAGRRVRTLPHGRREAGKSPPVLPRSGWDAQPALELVSRPRSICGCISCPSTVLWAPRAFEYEPSALLWARQRVACDTRLLPFHTSGCCAKASPPSSLEELKHLLFPTRSCRSLCISAS